MLSDVTLTLTPLEILHGLGISSHQRSRVRIRIPVNGLKIFFALSPDIAAAVALLGNVVIPTVGETIESFELNKKMVLLNTSFYYHWLVE